MPRSPQPDETERRRPEGKIFFEFWLLASLGVHKTQPRERSPIAATKARPRKRPARLDPWSESFRYMIARWGPVDCDLLGLGPVPVEQREEMRPTFQSAVLRCLETSIMLRDWSLVREGTRHLAQTLEP